MTWRSGRRGTTMSMPSTDWNKYTRQNHESAAATVKSFIPKHLEKMKKEWNRLYPSRRSLYAGRMMTAILCAAGKMTRETIGTAIFPSCHRMENCQSERMTAILLIYFPGWTMAS